MTKAAKEKLAFQLLTIASVMVLIPTVGIIVYIVIKGLPAINWSFLTEPPRNMMTEGGIYPAIMGTLYLVLGTMAIALPLGVGAAVYLNEYAGNSRVRRLVHLAIVNLAGVPSVVYGLFGLGFFVVVLGFGRSLIAGSLTLAIMILPVIITTTEEALKSVPNSYREASLALGATKWQTVRNAVLPSATPGIITGTILGIGRAAGETAPILFTVAAFYLPSIPKSIFDQAMALPYHLYILVTEVPNVPEETKFGTALVLLTLVVGLNLVAVLIRTRTRRRSY